MKQLFFTFFTCILLIPGMAFAQSPDSVQVPEEYIQMGQDQGVPQVKSEEVRARVVEILEETEVDGQDQAVFVAETEDGERLTVDTSQSLVEGLRYQLKEGQSVYLEVLRNDAGVEAVYLVDIVRTSSLIWIFVLFSVLTLAVGLWRGFAALVGLMITLGILFLFILPQILSGSDPVLVTVVGAAVMLAVNMHLSHGFSKSTLFAFASTLIGLVLVLVLSEWFVAIANLSGLADEESVLLYFQAEAITWPAGILLAGIILGAVGVLDDIAITQSETVQELHEANPELDWKELFGRAMRVGRHHIASTVNTLVLAYAGVAMPLLLLFLSTSDIEVGRFLNEELVAEEIVRTLAGTIALVLTVPISTLFATFTRKS